MESIVKRVLEYRGVRQNWLAQHLGVSDALLSLLLSGKQRWRREYRAKAAFLLQVPEDILFFDLDCSQKLQNQTHEPTQEHDA
jgi:hypothetical protein